jgi:hypothetical protein
MRHLMRPKGAKVMKLRYIAAAAAIGASAFFFGHSADASSPTLQTITQSETIVSANCYETHKVTVTYYEHSKTKGWVKYPSPKRTTTDSEHCDA